MDLKKKNNGLDATAISNQLTVEPYSLMNFIMPHITLEPKGRESNSVSMHYIFDLSVRRKKKISIRRARFICAPSALGSPGMRPSGYYDLLSAML